MFFTPISSTFVEASRTLFNMDLAKYFYTFYRHLDERNSGYFEHDE